MRSVLTATPGMCHTRLATVRLISALVHVEVPLHLIVKVVVTGPTRRPSSRSVGTTLFNIYLRRLVITYCDFQVITTILSTPTTRVIMCTAS